jgi:hypothetical protein
MLEKLPEDLPPRRRIDHVIKVMPGVAPLAKAPYRMNHEEFKNSKFNSKNSSPKDTLNLANRLWGTRLFCSQEGWDVEDVCGL